MNAFDLKKARELSKQLASFGSHTKPKVIKKKPKGGTSLYSFPYKALRQPIERPVTIEIPETQDLQPRIESAVRQALAEAHSESKPIEVTAELVTEIVRMMHQLPEQDKLEVSKGIRNAQSFIYGGTKYKMEEMMHGGGSTSSTTVYYTPTGTVDGSNQVFIVTAQPSSVTADGITYFEGAGYVYAALQITMTVPPSQYVRYTL